MKRILVASHISEAYGLTYPLTNFLKRESPEPIFILHPFQDKMVWLHFLKDFFVTLFLSFRYLNKYDVYIGVNCLNAFPGLIIKVFSPAKKFIYCSADYSTERFGNSFFDKLYISLDRLCSQRADYNWSVSERIREVKRGFGVSEEKNLLVPNGVHLANIKQRDLLEVERNSLVYVGHLTKTKGVQEIILGLKDALRYNERLKLKIIGSGPYEIRLKKMVEEEGLEDRVDFLGHKSNKGVLETLSKYAVGLAPYNLDDDYTYYCDPIKVKEYLAAGCPVVITDVPYMAQMIKERKCGVVISDFCAELATAVQAIFRSEAEYQDFRRRAKEAARRFDWDDIFARAFREVGV